MSPPPTLIPLLVLLGCERGFADPSRASAPASSPDAPVASVQIHVPRTTGVVDTPLRDVHGTPVGVTCATCHAGEGQTRIIEGSGAPESFHTGLKPQHGTLGCVACHTEDRLALHLADGARVEFGEVMRLCGQCHGPQLRDYNHGAHGGMTGHWDLRAGGRERASCVDCHDAHSPAIEPVTPAPGPLDRFARAEGDHE